MSWDSRRYATSRMMLATKSGLALLAAIVPPSYTLTSDHAFGRYRSSPASCGIAGALSEAMMRAVFTACVLGVAMLTSAAATAQTTAVAPSEPGVFSSRGFDEALASTRQSGRVLVVMFSAQWCGPCKAMENSTWRDAGVAAWVRDHGEALHVDVEKQKALADRYDVRSLPLLIAFRDGEPVERSLGYKDPQQMVTWLNRVGGARAAATLAPSSPATFCGLRPPTSTSPTQIMMPTTTRVLPGPRSTTVGASAAAGDSQVRGLYDELTRELKQHAGDVKAQNAARREFRARVAAKYAAALPGPDATRVLRDAIHLDDTAWMRIALVHAAIDRKQSRPELAQLLQEAKAKGADVSKTQARLNAMK